MKYFLKIIEYITIDIYKPQCLFRCANTVGNKQKKINK